MRIKQRNRVIAIASVIWHAVSWQMLQAIYLYQFLVTAIAGPT